MKTICKYLFLIMIYSSSFAQYNLVKNPSFEQFDTCPDNYSQIYHSLFWTNPLFPSTPDYLNACGTPVCSVPGNLFGYEVAHTGVAYAAIITGNQSPNPAGWNYREYLQTELADSLKGGVNYCIRFYVSACDSAWYVSNDMGIYFSETEIKDTCSLCSLPYVAQYENPSSNNLNSRNGWTEISGVYNATGGEKYIIIGNFKDTTSSVQNFVGWSQNNYFYPTHYYIDDVLITPCDSLVGVNDIFFINKGIRVYPSKVDNNIFIESLIENIEHIEIFNCLGQKVNIDKVSKFENRTVVDLSSMKKGIYIVSVMTKNHLFNSKVIKQ